MVKLAIVDLDGVVANVDARFARAEDIKVAAWNDRSVQLGERERTATERYWRAVFDPEQVPTTFTDDDVRRVYLYVASQRHAKSIIVK